jgi:hypothetical protein
VNAKEITALLREVSGQIFQDWGYLADKLEDAAAAIDRVKKEMRE